MTMSVKSPAAFAPAHAGRPAPDQLFEKLVLWLADMASDRKCPGLVVGISGTDSALAFLAAAKAFERIGRPDRVHGIHYGRVFPSPDHSDPKITRMLEVAPDLGWVQRSLFPWLQTHAPGARLTVDDTINYRSDNHRWAALFDRSLNGTHPTEPLLGQGTYWVLGTRNRTEDLLGAYSALSAAASVQPLITLWKSDVLRICQHLGIPKIAMDRSRQVDCDCGRFEVAAAHIREIDHILMARAGLLASTWPGENIEPELLSQLNAFIDEQSSYGAFKRQIPYAPPGDLTP